MNLGKANMAMSPPQQLQQQQITQTRGEILFRNQQYFQKQIETKTQQMLDNFHSIIKIAKVNENSQNFSETYEMETRTTNILNSGEGLLKIIEELKQNIILNDFSTMTEEVRLQNMVYQRQNEKTNKLIKLISEEISKSIAELENEYYNSDYKLPPTTSLSSETSTLTTDSNITPFSFKSLAQQ